MKFHRVLRGPWGEVGRKLDRTDRIFAELSAGGSQNEDGCAGRPFEIYELIKSRTVRALAPRLPVSRLYRNDFAMVTEYLFCQAKRWPSENPRSFAVDTNTSHLHIQLTNKWIPIEICLFCIFIYNSRTKRIKQFILCIHNYKTKFTLYS